MGYEDNMAATAPFCIHSEEEEDSLILISLDTGSSLEQRLLLPPPVPMQLLKTRPFPDSEHAASLQAFMCFIP